MNWAVEDHRQPSWDVFRTPASTHRPARQDAPGHQDWLQHTGTSQDIFPNIGGRLNLVTNTVVPSLATPTSHPDLPGDIRGHPNFMPVASKHPELPDDSRGHLNFLPATTRRQELQGDTRGHPSVLPATSKGPDLPDDTRGHPGVLSAAPKRLALPDDTHGGHPGLLASIASRADTPGDVPGNPLGNATGGVDVFEHLGSTYSDERPAVLGDARPVDGGEAVDRSGFAAISAAQLKEIERAKLIFLQHLEEVQVPITGRAATRTEIITFHLTGEAFKVFNRFVRSYNCRAHRRRLLKYEQEKLKGPLRNRRCVNFTQVTVSYASKIQFLEMKSGGLESMITDENRPPLN